MFESSLVYMIASQHVLLRSRLFSFQRKKTKVVVVLFFFLNASSSVPFCLVSALTFVFYFWTCLLLALKLSRKAPAKSIVRTPIEEIYQRQLRSEQKRSASPTLCSYHVVVMSAPIFVVHFAKTPKPQSL